MAHQIINNQPSLSQPDTTTLRDIYDFQGNIWVLAHFNTLKPEELYKILQLRESVFTIEQKCNEEDIDGKDLNAHHLMAFTHQGELIAYTRLYQREGKGEEKVEVEKAGNKKGKGQQGEKASFGRFVVAPHVRGQGLGQVLLEQTLNQSKKIYPTHILEISAQAYLENFYKNVGFKVLGSPYLEAGIPHLKMKLVQN